MSWEETFAQWAKPPSQTEQEKMENAERAIRKAIQASEKLEAKDIEVFAQGSYKNRTNVRLDSDVDICVLCTNTLYFEIPNGKTSDEFGIKSPAEYQNEEYRNDVENALTSYFGADSLSSGNVAWNLHENTYRVDSDVVACFEHREYFENGNRRTGTAVLPKSGSYICNFPKQNYQSGKWKNDETSKRFRKCVRILKNLSNYIAEQEKSFEQLPSFLIESLVWNVPNSAFGNNSFTDDIRSVLAKICDDTRTDEDCKKWTEVNGIKYLFHQTQKWNRGQVNSSMNRAWSFVGFN